MKFCHLIAYTHAKIYVHLLITFKLYTSIKASAAFLKYIIG